MNWYIAKVIFRIVSGDGDHCAQFDEQLRLIEATSEAAAIEKANKIGIAGQDSFLNIQRETVSWEFIAVTEVNSISGLTDGAEIYYRLHETNDAAIYIALARHRAALLAPAVKQL